MTLRVLLADDHRIVREGLRALLERLPGVEVVGEARDGREAVDAAGRTDPDIVLMDLAMPSMNGIEATRRIVASRSGVRVLCLSMHVDRAAVLAALDAGAAGFLPKECAPEELERALRAVADGGTYLSPTLAGEVVAAYREGRGAERGRPAHGLTAREREILQLVAEGRSTKEIAARLGVSAKTVGTHREHIMEKLGIHSIAGLTRWAIREGLSS